MFFITLDITRAIGLEKALPDLRIICLYRTPLADQMRSAGVEVLCLEEIDVVVAPHSSSILLHPVVQDWVREREDNPEILLFKSTPKTEAILRHLGWKSLSPDPELNRLFEDKITFYEICMKLGVSTPETLISTVGAVQWSDIEAMGGEAVLQLRRGHAGENSFLISSEQHLAELQGKLHHAHQIKITRKLSGKTLTVNCCIADGELLIGDLMEQITGIPELNRNRFGTCGVTIRYDQPFPSALSAQIQQLGAELAARGYCGIFGIDALEEPDGTISMIECNPRLTATISFHTQIQMRRGMKPYIARACQRSIGTQSCTLPAGSNPTQIILRNTGTEEAVMEHGLQSGIYEYANGVLKFIRPAMHLNELTNDHQVLLLIRPSGSRVSSNLEIGFVQSLVPLVTAGNAGPIVQAFMQEIRSESRIHIQSGNFWRNRYGSVNAVAGIYRHPYNTTLQSQALPNEPLFTLLGEHELYFLVRKYEGTTGWILKSAVTERSWSDMEPLPPITPTEFLGNWHGAPYLWGGITKSGVDCSGFIQQFFLYTKGLRLPKYSQDQRKFGISVSIDELEDNDIVFLTSRAKGTSHVALYYQGELWHACLKHQKVIAQNLNAVLLDYQLEEIRRL